MTLIGISLAFHVHCGGCRTAMPINGTCETIDCYVCGRSTELAKFWETRFDPDDFEPFLVGDNRTEVSAGSDSRLAYGREQPACAKCRAVIDLAKLSSDITCACGHAIRVRPADAIAKRIDRRAVFLVGETHVPIAIARAARVFKCEKCGGALDADGTVRSIACKFCNAANVLPEFAPTLEPFYLVVDYDADAIREARWKSSDERARDATRHDLTAALYGQLRHDDDDDVRAALAANEHAPLELVEVLAIRDDDSDVRAAAVRNAKLSHAALLEVATSETDEHVLGVLAARPDLTAEMAEALARSPSVKARVHAATHPSLPLETLRKLSRDDNDTIARAAKQRIEELEAKGTEVPGGGFFGKLFGR